MIQNPQNASVLDDQGYHEQVDGLSSTAFSLWMTGQKTLSTLTHQDPANTEDSSHSEHYGMQQEQEYKESKERLRKQPVH
jgi:hypothetical protein